MKNEYLQQYKEYEKITEKHYSLCSEMNRLSYAELKCREIKSNIKGLVEDETYNLLLTLEEKIAVEVKYKEKEREDSGRYYNKLKNKLNTGNLRHVVNELMRGEGLEDKDFAEAIGYTEKDIVDLKQEGRVGGELLESICNYFGIKSTEEFSRYVWHSDYGKDMKEH